MARKWSVVCLLLALVSGAALVLRGNAEVTILNRDGEGAGFGFAIDVNEDVLACGMYNAGTNRKGALLIFRRAANGSWALQQTLTGLSEERLGSAVAVSGDSSTIAAGTFSGLHIFGQAANGSWTLQAKFTVVDVVEPASVALSHSGDTAVVGTWTGPPSSGSEDAAHVFVRAVDGTWTQQAKLQASDQVLDHPFADTVSISGDGGGTIVAPAWAEGSVYVFAWNGSHWAQQAKLTGSDAVVGVAGDVYGYSVAMSEDGDTIVAGAYADDDAGSSSGSAYVHARMANGTWVEQAKLVASDGAASDRFGQAVAISGDILAVAAPGCDDPEFDTGAVYVFVRAANGTWAQHAKLVAPDAAETLYLGLSLAVDGDTMAVGSYRTEVGPFDRVYLFQLNLTTATTTASPATASVTPLLSTSGQARAAGGNPALLLWLSGLTLLQLLLLQ